MLLMVNQVTHKHKIDVDGRRIIGKMETNCEQRNFLNFQFECCLKSFKIMR